jgi:hypothetical protein
LDEPLPIVPELVPSDSQSVFSLAFQESVAFEVFLRVMDADVALVPRSTLIGAISNFGALAAASALESKSTGEEELQAAAMAAHTTKIAAQQARRT